MCPELDKTQFIAVDQNNKQEVDILLTSRVDFVNLQNPEEKIRTALHLAAHKERCELVRLLVDKHQANVNIEDTEGDIPLQLATDRYHMNVVKFLLSRNSNRREYVTRFLNSDEVEEWFQVVEANDVSKVTELLNGGVDVNSVDLYNLHRTALEVSSTRGDYDLVQLLVDQGADLEHADDCSECAYRMAVNNGHDNIANFLVERGFKDDDATSSSSDTDVSLNWLPNLTST